MKNQALCKGKFCKAKAVADMMYNRKFHEWNRKFHLKNLISIQMEGSDSVHGENWFHEENTKIIYCASTQNLHREVSSLLELFFNISMNQVYCYSSNTAVSCISFDITKQFSSTKAITKTQCGQIRRRQPDVTHVSLSFFHCFSSC